MKILVPILSQRESGKFVNSVTKKDIVYLALIINPKKFGPMKCRLFLTRLEKMKENLGRMHNLLGEKGIRKKELILWGDIVTEIKSIIRARKIERIIIKKQNKGIGKKLSKHCKVVVV